MPTRQQKRAKQRSPAKRSGGKGRKPGPRRTAQRTSVAFLAVILVIALGGSSLIALLRANPAPRTAGAVIGEHWHADYRIEICGRQLNPYPHVEGEIHSHGDGLIHLHPFTEAKSRDNANLGNFLLTYETHIGQQEGRTFIRFPDGTRYMDGDACRPDGGPERLVVMHNGREYTDDPFGMVVFDGDDVVIRFGPPATETAENPYSQVHPDVPTGPVE